ncbi:MAG: methyl-accepting chemotaxis protein, partial [Verrucomicrobia bacterium]|nr:methyl-accepting chemotaxis protein [Verrucomicrobiota bacterium]
SSNAFAGHLEFSPDGVFTGGQARITTVVTGNDVTNSFAWVTPFNNPKFVSEAGRLCVTNPAPNPTRHGDVSDETFVLAGGVFTGPQPAQGVKKDAAFDVQWVSAGMGPTVRLEVQAQPGGPWSLIDDAVPNISGLNTYAWTPTNAPTGGARLRLQSNSDPRAIGLSDLFSIAAVELVSPVGQENQDFTELWLQNTTNNITWTSGGASGFVNLSYSVDGGLTFTTISNNVPNVNSDLFVVTNVYSWVVAPFPTKLARVRIEDASDPTNLFDISTYDFKIAGLRVSFPDLATDSMEVRVEGPIQWDENDVGSLGTVQFSENGGATWQLVESGPILGTRQSLFTPTNPTLRGLVRIIADAPAPFTNVFDLSNSEFPVRGIRVAAPQQGGLYTIGTTNPITFVIAATFDADFRAQIYYAEDGFSFDRDNPLNGSFSFVDGIANTFSWIVEPSRRPSQSGRIMVESGPSGTPYSGVSEDFVLRGVKFDTPSAGAVWAPGTNEISWAVAGIANGATANILLSLAGGAPGTFTNTIVSGAAVDAFTANWVVPLGLGPSTSARLRFDVVSSPAGAFDTQYFADSDIFTLLGIRVLSPLGSSRWDMGTTQTITWDSASGGNRVDLLYSADGGVTFDPRPIAANVVSQNGTNSLSWAIDFQRTPSSNAVVRVASRSVPGLSGDSAPFYVRGIKINRPSGADIYASTDPTNLIQWVAANDTPTPFTIRYVKEAEAPVQIATDLAATNRIYNWAFPPLAAVSDNVRIEITDGIHTSTSSVFRIVSVATIQVISPSAGDFWEVGSTRQLQWSRGGFMPNDFTVYLVLSPYDATNAPLSVGAVAFDETNNVFSFSWEVPDNPGKGKIVVKHNTLSTVEDDSGEFSIVGKFEILNPPGPFDIYAMKPNTLVRWRTRGSVPFVDLYYSINENRDDWTKVNAAPIPNNNKPFNPGDVEGSWSISTYDWTVPNARVDAAAIRVQEALYTQEFAPTDTGPFDDSAEFPIYYYSIVWDVYDVVSGNALNSPTGRLDRLSVVDSSGWGQSDASAIPPNRLVNDYPWGSFNTEIYREGFFDRSILFWSSENTAISVPGPRAWTQRVVMVRSQITEEYHVLANFSYDANSTNFTINAWMERGGVILEQPTSCAVKIYDASGNTIDVIESATPSSGGVFWVYWDASGQPRGAVFFAKVEIIYSGSVYSSGLTFTLTIPLSDEFGGAIDDLKNAIGTNILESVGNVLTNVADLIDRVQALQGTTSSGFSNLTDLARITTNLLGEVRGDVKVLTNEVISVLGPKVDQLTNVITTIGLQTLARILSRPEAVAAGSTNSMLFKSKAGYATAQMAVVPLDGGGSPGPFTLNEVGGVGGLYEAPYIANWGLGRYRVTVSDPQGSSDSIVMRIVSGDLYDLPVQLGDFSNKLESIESQLINMSVASAAITNELLPLISGLSSNLATLTTNTAVDFAYIQEQVGFLTNGLATLTVLDEIADDIARLTNSLASVTNISDLVFQLTNALAGVSAGDIAAIGRGVDRLTNSFWNADWGTVMAIDSNVTRMTNAMFAMDGMVFDLDRVTQSLHNIDFARIQAGVIDTTNRLSALTGLAEISDQIRSLSNSLAQISALTNIAPTIAALGTNLLPINFQSMSQNITNIANTLAGVAGLDALANQIGQLSNSLSQISAVTNLSGSMSLLTNALLPINFAQMAADISSATGSLSALNGLDALAESLNGISNSLAAIGGIGNMTNQVHALYTNLQAANLGRMASDLGYATNRLSLLSSVPNQLNLLSNQLVGVSRDVGTVTNRLAQFDWGVITNIQALSMQTYTNIQTLENLADVARDLQNLTNAIAQLSGITNVGADVADITNALQGLNWADVLFIKTNVMIITNQLTALRDIGAISNSIAQLTNSIQQLTVLTNMPGQVGQIAAAVVGVDFRGLTNDVKNILTQVNQIDWNDILAVRSDLQYTTNVLAGLNDLPALLTAINGLTNATADLAQLGSFSTQLNAIAGAVVGVNFAKMYGDVVSVTSSLATAQINLLPGMQSTLVSISNLLAGLDLSTVTNLGVVVDTLSSNLTAVNWADIVELQSDMRTVTNTLAGLDELDGVILALNGLSNSLPALASVTNLGTQVGEIVDAIAGLTNALDWTDITDIQTNVHGLVTDLAALDTALAALQGLTNGLGGVGDLTNMQVQLSVLTNQLYGADWSDIRTLQRDMAVVTNSLGDIGALVGLGAQIDTLITTVEGVGVLTNTFATADWGDITVIDNSLRALSASLEGLAGVDLTSFDPQSNVRIESTLQSMASVDVVSQIALLMGTVQDTESDASFFGRLAAMQNKLSLVGVDAKNASLRSQNAKTKASAAAGAIQALQSDIEEGDVTKVMSRVHQIQGLLKETSDELARVPTDVDPATLNTQVRQMADAVNRLAASKGFERLLNFSGEAEG